MQSSLPGCEGHRHSRATFPPKALPSREVPRLSPAAGPACCSEVESASSIHSQPAALGIRHTFGGEMTFPGAAAPHFPWKPLQEVFQQPRPEQRQGYCFHFCLNFPHFSNGRWFCSPDQLGWDSGIRYRKPVLVFSASVQQRCNICMCPDVKAGFMAMQINEVCGYSGLLVSVLMKI